jgi:hypothetical protein
MYYMGVSLKVVLREEREIYTQRERESNVLDSEEDTE